MQNEDQKPTSNAAIGSVALAIAGLFIFGIYAGLAAVGLGFYAKAEIEKGRGKGLKTAMAGIARGDQRRGRGRPEVWQWRKGR